MVMGASDPLGISWTIVGVLLLMLLAASAVFWLLARRETVWRRWFALGEWARTHGAKLYRAPKAFCPEPLKFLSALHPRARLLLESEKWSMVELFGDAPPQSGDRGGRWRILLRRIDADWPPTALRPVTHVASLSDQLTLTSFPSLAAGGRFVVFGSAASAAKALAQSSAEALMPPDVGLVLARNLMMLDFSSRPFDTIEFGRILALSEQLAGHLPRVVIAVAENPAS